MIFVSALQVDKAVFFTAAITVTAFVPLFTMQGRRRTDLRTDGANLRLRARRRAARDVHGDAGPRLAAAAEARRGNRDHHRAGTAQEPIRRCCAGRSPTSGLR